MKARYDIEDTGRTPLSSTSTRMSYLQPTTTHRASHDRRYVIRGQVGYPRPSAPEAQTEGPALLPLPAAAHALLEHPVERHEGRDAEEVAPQQPQGEDAATALRPSRTPRLSRKCTCR